MRVRVSRIVLVGLPGAGKTAVAPLLAGRLGWRWVDTDRRIAAEQGLDIAAIFLTRGEAAFRRLEREAVVRALDDDGVVIAPGGGWAARPDAFDAIGDGTVVVWLQVSAPEAARRLERDDVERPLLAQDDMASRLARLEAERKLSYARASMIVSTDGSTPEAIADDIARRLVSDYGIDGRSY